VCKTHGPIAVFFCQVGRRSNLCNDSLSCVVQLSSSIRPLLFGRKFEHLLRCVCLTLIHDYSLSHHSGSRDDHPRSLKMKCSAIWQTSPHSCHTIQDCTAR